MNNPWRGLYALALGALIVAVPSVWAQWAPDGVPVCTVSGDQERPAIIPDGSGGAIVAWEDYRSGDYDIYVQRIDAAGEERWTAGGVAVCVISGTQYAPQTVSDGSGGVIVTWQDNWSGNWDIFVQRIDASGATRWMPNGVVMCAEAGVQGSPRIVSDGAGGAIVTWYDYRAGNWDIYAQRVDASGAAQWAIGGVVLCAAAGDQYYPQIASDGFGGAIVTWYDNRAGNYDIYAQRVNAEGEALWVADGKAVCTVAGTQSNPRIVYDGSSYAIVTWMDYRAGNYDIYAQRISRVSGTVKWLPIEGVALCAAVGLQRYPEIVSDGFAGAIVTWQDYRSGDYDIYAQRVSSEGTVQWTADGIALCAVTGTQNYPVISSDCAGGAVVTWQDFRGGDYDIYVQRVNASGAALLTAGGVSLCVAAGNQGNPGIMSDGAGGAIVVWEDERSGESDIYAQSMDGRGRIGFLAPEIDSVRDVPDDQGGAVYLSWYAARLDLLMNSAMSHYTIWRAIDAERAALMVERGAAMLESPSELDAAGDRSVIRGETLYGRTWLWELVDTLDAYHFEAYGKATATLFDSTAACGDYHYFQVIAHTSDPMEFWVSAPDSGRSIDNLSPCAPLSLAGAQSHSPEGLLITWKPNEEPDLGGYRVYRGLGEEFEPAAYNLLASPADEAYFDGEWNRIEGYYYKVSAVDLSGNESGWALLRPDEVTGCEPSMTPRVSRLMQNYPNPFNPNTIIAFEMEARGYAILRIYDAAGRLVATLLDGTRPAGRYAIEWDGRDDAGRQAASGVYFYRLDAGEFSATRKMILLR